MAVEEEVKELGTEPSGTLRLNVSHEAESVLGGTFLGDFLNAFPRVRLDLVVTTHNIRGRSWRPVTMRRWVWAR